MADKKGYGPTYRDELAISRHFVQVLEQKLAGRESVRRTNVHPLDWCHLGVIGPAKQQHAPVELDAAALEAEPTPDGAIEAKVANDGSTAEIQLTGTPASNAQPEPPDAASEPEDLKAAEKNDDREGTRRPPSAIGFEALVQPGADGAIELTLNASFSPLPFVSCGVSGVSFLK